MRIGIIKLGALGDVLRTTSILRPLHGQYPSSRIWWFTSLSALPLLERNPWIHRWVKVPEDLSETLFQIDFDWVISLDEDPAACEVASRLKSKQLVGAYQDRNGRLRYTESSKKYFDMGLLNREVNGSLTTANRLKQANTQSYQDILCDVLGLQESSKESLEIVLSLDPQEEQWAKEFAQEKGLKETVLGLNSGAGSRWPTKQLSIEKTRLLLDRFKSFPHIQCLLLGGREETGRNRDILRGNENAAFMDTGTENSISRFMSIVNLCDVVITSDSLTFHMASALKKKIIVFVGPTSSSELELYGRAWMWLPSQPCQCFYKSVCQASIFCLDTLDMDRLFLQLQQWINL